MILYTIGHSNRALSDFLDMLQSFEIDMLIDVRKIPKSRFVPWSNTKNLETSLAEFNIGYQHVPALGGMRHPHKDSINMGWRNVGFRGFADYMQTNDFFLALKALNQLIKTKQNIVIMCAEGEPFRCHRSLIADAEIVRGVKVLHILGKNVAKEHELTSFAVVERTKRPIHIFYPEW